MPSRQLPPITAMVSDSSNSPIGTLIGPPAKAWRVGRELGRGACGSVHEIARDISTTNSSKSDFVVKISSLPPASATAAKSKKRKKTPQERNADLLYQENVYYRNVLNDLRGTVVPEVPHPGEGGPPVYGDAEGKPPHACQCFNCTVLIRRSAGLASLFIHYMCLFDVCRVRHGQTIRLGIPILTSVQLQFAQSQTHSIRLHTGYRFLCMERMDGPLTDVVPLLIASAKKKKKTTTGGGSFTSVDLGPIATTLISHVEAFHDMRLLFVDVKADNFMLAPEHSAASGSKKKKGRKSTTSSSSASQLLANRIRLIDFGLVEKYRDLSKGGHREDAHPDAQFVGTPEYASINVLSGHTPSRRDDLEAVGYVLSDILIRAVRYGTGGTGKSKHQQGDIFPWSSCQSDEDVLNLKLAEVDECLSGGGGKKPSSSGRAGKTGKVPASTFFASLGAGGNEEAEGVMMEYFSAVRNLKYSEKPDYDHLRDVVSGLRIKITADDAGAAQSRSPRIGRDDESGVTDYYTALEEEKKEGESEVQLEALLEKSGEVEESVEQEESEEVEESEDEESDKVESEDEETPPEFRLVVTGGPGHGEWFYLCGEGHPNSVTIGASPSKLRHESTWAISDQTSAPSQVSVVAFPTLVRVHAHTEGVTVNKKPVSPRPWGFKSAGAGGVITYGKTSILIQRTQRVTSPTSTSPRSLSSGSPSTVSLLSGGVGNGNGCTCGGCIRRISCIFSRFRANCIGNANHIPGDTGAE